MAVSEFSLENQSREFLNFCHVFTERKHNGFRSEVPIHSMDTPLLVHFSFDAITIYLQD